MQLNKLKENTSVDKANREVKVADFPITISGMLAASHKEGGPTTAKYLKSLEKKQRWIVLSSIS